MPQIKSNRPENQYKCWKNLTITQVFEKTVASFANNEALIDPLNRETFTSGGAQRFSFAELAAYVDQLAAIFFEQGIRKGDHVGVFLPNIHELPATLLALFKIGAIVNPYPPQIREYELSQMASFVKIKALVTIDEFKDRSLTELAVEASSKIPSLTTIFSFGSTTYSNQIVVGLDKALKQEHSLSPFEAYQKENPVDPNDMATICWTSGTTGMPKGVPRTHNLWTILGSVMQGLDFDHHTVFLTPFPMINMAGIGGSFIPWLTTGCTFVLHQPFELPIFLKQIAVEKVTYTIAPPAILNLLLKNKEILDQVDISSLKTIGSGSAPLSFWMIKTWKEKYGIDITNFFGSNEGIALIGTPLTIPDMEKRAKLFPAFGYDKNNFNSIEIQREMKTKLVDIQTGREITKEDHPGELYVKGPTIFQGYYNSESTNEEVFDAKGYFKTGDVFKRVRDNEDVYYYEFIERCKDIVIRGGFNIAPSEIESLLQDFEKIKESAIVGYPDEIMGERLALFIVLKPNQKTNLDEIIHHLKSKKIASYKIPEKLVEIDSVPRNPVGKILRRQLREKL